MQPWEKPNKNKNKNQAKQKTQTNEHSQNNLKKKTPKNTLKQQTKTPCTCFGYILGLNFTSHKSHFTPTLSDFQGILFFANQILFPFLYSVFLWT